MSLNIERLVAKSSQRRVYLQFDSDCASSANCPGGAIRSSQGLLLLEAFLNLILRGNLMDIRGTCLHLVGCLYSGYNFEWEVNISRVHFLSLPSLRSQSGHQITNVITTTICKITHPMRLCWEQLHTQHCKNCFKAQASKQNRKKNALYSL